MKSTYIVVGKQSFIYSLHVLAWILVLIVPNLLSFKKAIEYSHVIENPHELQNMLSWILLVVFSYTNHLNLVPRLYLERKYKFYASAIIISLVLLLSLPNLIANAMLLEYKPQMPQSGPPPKPSFVLEYSHFLLLFVVSVLISVSYHTRRRLHQIEEQRLQAELDHLKAQIHPHFLFNTLNSIYALAIRKDDKTANAIVQLSNFLRYVIRDATDNYVELSKEIDYIQNYIDIQKSRLRNSVDISYIQTGKTESKQIAPLILFSFIENAFKHGVSPEEPSIINVIITVGMEVLELIVENKKVAIRDDNEKMGVGIANATNRLDLLYYGRYSLMIDDGEYYYKMKLEINL